jgi:hypothetical protein
VALGAFLVLTCLRAWTGPGRWERLAHAQIPNAGAQRAELLDEVRRTNGLLEEVLAILRTRTIKVEIQDKASPNAKGAAADQRATTGNH